MGPPCASAVALADVGEESGSSTRAWRRPPARTSCWREEECGRATQLGLSVSHYSLRVGPLRLCLASETRR
jgi:hypothetical protein